jgi:hypothetical protein
MDFLRSRHPQENQALFPVISEHQKQPALPGGSCPEQQQALEQRRL